LRRLAAYPRQNALVKALREIGRLERTLFTLDWISDPAFRRRTNAGLNKGEAPKCARAVFFHRLAEIRDRTFENQRYRAAGLNPRDEFARQSRARRQGAVAVFLRGLAKSAEQLTRLQKWRVILSRAF
jgi:Tn3 transposase DDE domain